MKTLSIWTGAIAIAAFSAGCTTSDPVTSEREGGVVGQTTDAVQDAGNAVGDAVLNGGRAADAAVETLDVKTALVADSRIDAGDINVDTSHETKTVTLKGRVPTEAQRMLAQEVAVKNATGYRVENQLTIGS